MTTEQWERRVVALKQAMEQEDNRRHIAFLVGLAAPMHYNGAHDHPHALLDVAERLAALRAEPQERTPDAMCHASAWRRHLDEWDHELTVRAFDPEKCDQSSGNPPWPVWIARQPTDKE